MSEHIISMIQEVVDWVTSKFFVVDSRLAAIEKQLGMYK